MGPSNTARGLPYAPVSRATIQDHVYGRLREMILTGGIEPGRTVTVQSLADAFGVSAMPVREALHRLVAEKALTVVAGRSIGIPFLSVERLADLCRVRLEIEGTAVAWATGRLGSADIETLGGLIEEMEQAAAGNDRSRYVPANREFHFTVYRAADSEALLAVIESLWLQIGPFINLIGTVDGWGVGNEQHRLMHAALVDRDPEAARAALQRDIKDAAGMLERMLDNGTLAKDGKETNLRRLVKAG